MVGQPSCLPRRQHSDVVALRPLVVRSLHRRPRPRYNGACQLAGLARDSDRRSVLPGTLLHSQRLCLCLRQPRRTVALAQVKSDLGCRIQIIGLEIEVHSIGFGV